MTAQAQVKANAGTATVLENLAALGEDAKAFNTMISRVRSRQTSVTAIYADVEAEFAALEKGAKDLLKAAKEANKRQQANIEKLTTTG